MRAKAASAPASVLVSVMRSVESDLSALNGLGSGRCVEEWEEDTTRPVAAGQHAPEEPEKVANGHADPARTLAVEDALVSSDADELQMTKNVLFAPGALEPVPDAAADAQDEDTEKEGEGPDTPGKRKGIRRGKRGKKKKGVAIVIPKDEGEQNAEPTPTPMANGGGSEGSKEAASGILLAPSAPPTPAAPTLVVSDTVLGMFS